MSSERKKRRQQLPDGSAAIEQLTTVLVLDLLQAVTELFPVSRLAYVASACPPWMGATSQPQTASSPSWRLYTWSVLPIRCTTALQQDSCIL
jgi:hypothetical protein